MTDPTSQKSLSHATSVGSLFLEVRPWKARVGAPYFVPLGGETGLVGYRSVYAYTEATRAHIVATGSSEGLASTPVYSDVLLLDFDNGDPGDLLVHLFDEGVGFTVWDSGNRSVHVHVPIEPMLGAYVPYSQRVWVQKHAPLADLTFYHQAGQYRLPRTVHEKTGRRKVLTASYPGELLQLPYVERPALTVVCGGASGSSALAEHLVRRKGVGSRTVYAWHLAKLARSEGVDFEVAVRRVLWWNTHYCTPPLDPDAVTEKVREVYAR